MPASFARAEILDQLDKCAAEFTFPMLDNGYVYLADVGLKAFRDANRWALLIERIGFNPRAGGHDGISNCLHLFGNCLSRPPGTANDDFLHLTDDGTEGATFDDDDFVRQDAKTIRIRNQIVPLKLSPEEFARHGIQLEEPSRICPHELLRLLTAGHRELFIASDEDIRERVPTDLPCVIELDSWHHPDLVNDELPSGSEAFQMIADVLVSGDSTRYRPTEQPNTHWANWPDGGTL